VFAQRKENSSAKQEIQYHFCGLVQKSFLELELQAQRENTFFWAERVRMSIKGHLFLVYFIDKHYKNCLGALNYIMVYTHS